jgi:hypothetical protein
MNRKGEWMQTASGNAYWPADPLPSEVRIEDIAHALSLLCRYGGHCSRFYSVAEHSVLVSQVVPERFALVGLLHDATEAYVVDVPRPIKHMLRDYADLEAANWRAIAHRFDLPEQMPPCVKVADTAVLPAEKNVLMTTRPGEWEAANPGDPARVSIVGYAPERARRLFLDRFHSLYKQESTA